MKLSLEHEGVIASVEPIGRSPFYANKMVYRWAFVDAQTEGTLMTGEDLESPMGDGLSAVLVTLLNFLSAWAESSEGAENGDLFDNKMRDVVAWGDWTEEALVNVENEGE